MVQEEVLGSIWEFERDKYNEGTTWASYDQRAGLPSQQDGGLAGELAAYHGRIEKLLAQSAKLPRKQRYTSKQIYKAIRKDGCPGAESTVRYYVSQQRKALKRPAVYLPLTFDPGADAQVRKALPVA